MSGTRTSYTPQTDIEIPEELIKQAVEWAVKIHFGEVGDEERQGLDRWLQSSPLHQEAWRRMQSMHQEFSDAPHKRMFQTLTSFDEQQQKKRLERRQALKVLTIFCVFVISAVLGYRWAPWQRLLADTTTATGEQRVAALKDQSIVRLNTDTAISEHYDTFHRRIELLRGEIAVATGKDPATGGEEKRPFLVTTPYGTLEALGTRFTVRLRKAYARVDVQEGAVRMQPENGKPLVVKAGSAGLLYRQHAVPASPLDYTPEGWTDGVLAVRKMPLKKFLSELSRYRTGEIFCAPEVADLPISGIYYLADTDKALAFLQQTQPIKVVYRTSYWVSVYSAGAASAAKDSGP